MKRLLKQKSHHVILEGFLSELFGQDVRVTDLLDTESIAEKERDKTNRVDLLCKNNRGELIIIELQYYLENDYFQRMLFSASKLVLEYLSKNSVYGEIKKVYAIHIVYFNLGSGVDYVYRGRQQFIGIHHNDPLELSRNQKRYFKGTEPADLYPEYYIINICNFKHPFEHPTQNTLDEWIYYFKYSTLPLGYRAKGLDEAEKQLNIDHMKPEVKEEYMKQLSGFGISEKMLMDNWFDGEAEGEYKGFVRGKEEGREEGREEGLSTGIRIQLEKTVHNMFKHGMSLESIAEITDIATSEVMEILKNNIKSQ